MEDSADSSEMKTSNQRVEVDSEEPLEVSESGDSDREEEPSRNSRLGLGDENIEGTKSKKTSLSMRCFICLFIHRMLSTKLNCFEKLYNIIFFCRLWCYPEGANC